MERLLKGLIRIVVLRGFFHALGFGRALTVLVVVAVVVGVALYRQRS